MNSSLNSSQEGTAPRGFTHVAATTLQRQIPLWSPASVEQVLLAAVLVLVTIALRRRYLSPIKHIPGPFVASFTRAWHAYHILKGDQNLALQRQHDKHGPFVRISHDEVSVCHQQAPKALYLSPVPKGNFYKIVVYPDWRFRAAVAYQDPKEKAELMKYHSNAGFLQHNILRNEDIIDRYIGGMLEWIDSASQSHTPSHLDQHFTHVAYDIAGHLTFSQSFGFVSSGSDVNAGIALNKKLTLFLMFAGQFPWLRDATTNTLVASKLKLLPVGHIVGTAKRALGWREKEEDELNGRKREGEEEEEDDDDDDYDEEKEKEEEGGRRRMDMAGFWLRGLRKAKKEGFQGYKRGHLLAAATSNLGAGSETVSCAIQSVIYHLLRSRSKSDYFARLRNEIDDAVRQGKLDATGVVSHEQASRLPYLEACIKEGLRIFAPVPMGLPRVAPKGGITLGDITFPQGTTLSVNPYVLQLSPTLWGPDAREFRPDRWFEDDISTKEKCFMPWGQGWAICPGQHLTRVQMFKILATLVRDYDIRQVNPNQEWTWKAYFTVNPENWPVYVSKREAPVS